MPVVFQKTCHSCPEQYWVYLDGHCIGYIHLRFGTLSCSHTKNLLPNLEDSTCVFRHDFNDGWKGEFDDDHERGIWLAQCQNYLVAAYQQTIKI